jgi:hypothetical protein
MQDVFANLAGPMRYARYSSISSSIIIPRELRGPLQSDYINPAD